MGKKTTISWTDHTFNPWWGCTKVSPGCDHCYAEYKADHRLHKGIWGPGKPRWYLSDNNWRQPLKWNDEAQVAGKSAKVFCASMGDLFDNEVEQHHRERLWRLIRQTPQLVWLLLTKRIGNTSKMLPTDWRAGYPNAWLILSVVTQQEADRDIPKLLSIPAVLRGLSVEPMLEPIELAAFISKLDWVICGGESKQGKEHIPRPFHPDWARQLREQCAATKTPFYMKQFGSNPIGLALTGKGENPAQWPDDLRIQQWPSEPSAFVRSSPKIDGAQLRLFP